MVHATPSAVYRRPSAVLHVANLPHHLIKPRRFVYIFLKRIVIEVVGRNKLHTDHTTAVVVNFLDIFHPDVAIRTYGI